jgi:hypothetical protein
MKKQDIKCSASSFLSLILARQLGSGKVVMPRSRILKIILVAGFAAITASSSAGSASAQKRPGVRHLSICGNPLVPCKTSATFQPNDLPFRVPQNAVIYDTELFYAIILKSVGTSEEDCNVFVPESERLAAQALFPDHKVFASRCPDVETLFYANISSKHRILAVYAGATLAEAKRMLAAVKATDKFPGAFIRRLRTGFNGT